jgi:hypothetical protein
MRVLSYIMLTLGLVGLMFEPQPYAPHTAVITYYICAAAVLMVGLSISLYCDKKDIERTIKRNTVKFKRIPRASEQKFDEFIL